MSIPESESTKSGGRSLPRKIIRCFQQGLAEELGKVRGREVLAKVQTRYSALLGLCIRYPERALRMHLEKNILPALALYQVLREEGITQAPALEVVDRIIEIRVEAVRRRAAWVGKFALFYHLIRRFTRPVMRVSYPEAGWKVEWLEVGPKQVAFKIHQCFYWEVLTSFGAAELTSSFCRGDDLLYKDVSPHLRFERTKTIGRGDDCCDFRFVRTRSN